MINDNRNLIIAYCLTGKNALYQAQELKNWALASDEVTLLAIEYILADQDNKVKAYKILSQTAPTHTKPAVLLDSKTSSSIADAAASVNVSSSISAALFHKQTGIDKQDRKRLLQHLADEGALLLVVADHESADLVTTKLVASGVVVDSYLLPPSQTFGALLAKASAVLSTAAAKEQKDQSAAPKLEATNRAVLHYHRHNSDYEGWGLQVWDGCENETTWEDPLAISGTDAFGAFFIVPLTASASSLGYIIHKGDQKDLTVDQYLDFEINGTEVWIIQNTFGYLPAPTTDIENNDTES